MRRIQDTQMKNEDYIEHNQLVNAMVDEYKDRYREQGLYILGINIDEVSIDMWRVLLKIHMNDRPRRELTTSRLGGKQIAHLYEEPILPPLNVLTTEISDSEYQHLMWYWECAKGILETKIKLKQEWIRCQKWKHM